MRITRNQLRQLIQEETGRLNESELSKENIEDIYRKVGALHRQLESVLKGEATLEDKGTDGETHIHHYLEDLLPALEKLR
jgi:hypothetical protein